MAVLCYGRCILRGAGGVRFADFVLRVGNKFVAIEVKANFPLAGSSLVRLAGQIRTFFWGQTQLFQAPPLK